MGEEKKEDEVKKPKIKKRIHRIQLKVVPVMSPAQTVRRLSAKGSKTASRRLRDMEAADELRQKRDAEKNSLEGFVFELRNQMEENSEELSKVSTDDEREKISEDLTLLEDWLYEDGEYGGANAELSVYQNKRTEMGDRVKAIFTRLIELEKRPKAVKAARDVLGSTKEIILLWSKERPQITEKETEEVTERVESITTWLDEKETEQEGKEDNVTPAFSSREVSNKMQTLHSLVSRLLKKQRPAPEKPKKVKKEDDEESSEEERTKDESEEEEEKEEKEEKEKVVEEKEDEEKEEKEEKEEVVEEKEDEEKKDEEEEKDSEEL